MSRSLRLVPCAVGFLLLASVVVHADNCGSRFDCYKTQGAALAAAVGIALFVGLITFPELFVIATIGGIFARLGQLAEKIDPTKEGNVLKVAAEMEKAGIDLLPIARSGSTLSAVLYWVKQIFRRR